MAGVVVVLDHIGYFWTAQPIGVHPDLARRAVVHTRRLRMPPGGLRRGKSRRRVEEALGKVPREEHGLGPIRSQRGGETQVSKADGARASFGLRSS